MDLSSGWRSRFADAVGRPTSAQALTATAWRVVVDGRRLVAKVGPGIEDEAFGLRRLACVAGRVDPAEMPTGADFYRARLSELAERCGLAKTVDAVVSRLELIIPPDGPSVVHGDLWWGNVLWGADGRPWLIDPSVHGGHPEEDLAMLALFGSVPRRLLDAYAEVKALGDGWQQRVELFQLYPVLVHAVVFGGSYRHQAEAIALKFS